MDLPLGFLCKMLYRWKRLLGNGLKVNIIVFWCMVKKKNKMSRLLKFYFVSKENDEDGRPSSSLPPPRWNGLHRRGGGLKEWERDEIKKKNPFNLL